MILKIYDLSVHCIKTIKGLPERFRIFLPMVLLYFNENVLQKWRGTKKFWCNESIVCPTSSFMSQCESLVIQCNLCKAVRFIEMPAL